MLTTLMFASVVLVIVYAVAEVFIKFTFFEQRMHVRRYSEVAAESAAATAAVRLKIDSDFGLDVENDVIEINDGELGTYQTAYVQFDPDSGKPYSVNNLNSDAVVSGYRGTPVPAYSAQIIGVGSYGDKESLFEIIISRPGITHAAASSGELILDGHNEAASLKTQQQLAELTGGTMLDPDEFGEQVRSTTVASGGGSGQPLVLKGDLTLYGDAISASGISQEGNIQFLHGGGPRMNDSSVEIPTIDDIEVYDPQALDGTTDLNPGYSDANNLFQGRNRCDGDLVIDGDLELDGALIYVTGNLTVRGNIKGDGALISLGDMNLTGHSTLQADSKVAMISKGDLSITGTDAERSLFSGLIYSESKVQASNITVVGGLVANNPEHPEQATMEVTDTKLINLPEKTKFDVTTTLSNPIAPPPRAGLYGRKLGLMEREGFTLVLPDINDYVGSDGLWTGETPTFKIEYDGVIYDRPEDIPGLSTQTTDQLRGNMLHAEAVWIGTLENLTPQTRTETVFQLDPNQLLTVSEGYKVILRRSLPGTYTSN